MDSRVSLANNMVEQNAFDARQGQMQYCKMWACALHDTVSRGKKEKIRDWLTLLVSGF
jgi:hypothetical protein